MAQQRLPYVDGDDGDWGDILNQFLKKEHVDSGTNDPDNGGHKNVTIKAGASSAGSAPLKFDTTGTLLAVPEAGAMEVEGEHLYYTGHYLAGNNRRVIPGYNPAGSAASDMYYRKSTDGNLETLAIGSPGEVLTVSAGNTPEWSLPPAGTTRSINAVSSNTAAGAATGTDYVYNVSGTTTVTLPAVTGNANVYTIKNAGNSQVTIATTGSDKIDGRASPLILQFANSSVDLVSDGTGSNWSIA